MYSVSLFCLFTFCYMKLSLSQTTFGPLGNAFPSACSWFEKRDTNTEGGNSTTYRTITECRKACQASPNRCKYGFDWDPQNPFYKCWISTSNIKALAVGVSHFSSTCPLTTPPYWSATAQYTTKPDGMNDCVWKQRLNTNTNNGKIVDENDLKGCKKRCFGMDKCKYGLDFNPFAQMGYRCYISMDRNLYEAPGITHYYPNCKETNTNPIRGDSHSITSEIFVVLSSILITLSGLVMTVW